MGQILKRISCLMVLFLITSLAFAQDAKENFSFEMNNISTEASIGPSDYIEFSPSISNIGNIPGYVCFKIDQPFIVEEGTPLYIFEINKPWTLLKAYILDERYISVFTYPDPLHPDKSTTPLFDGIQMSSIPIPVYAKLEDISLKITMYTSDTNDFGAIII